jgi:hypothetical protein
MSDTQSVEVILTFDENRSVYEIRAAQNYELGDLGLFKLKFSDNDLSTSHALKENFRYASYSENVMIDIKSIINGEESKPILFLISNSKTMILENQMLGIMWTDNMQSRNTPLTEEQLAILDVIKEEIKE